jgi:hypothetical protein
MRADELPEALALGLLALVRDGGERASWHWIGTRVARRDLPLVPDAMTALDALQAAGLIRRISPGGERLDRFELTNAGADVLAGRRALTAPAASGPLPAGELAALIAALRGDVVSTLDAIRPRAGDSLRLWAALRQAVAADPATALNAAIGALALAEADRAAFLGELVGDPRPAVRAAAFAAFAPPHSEAPGTAMRSIADPELDALLRRGLADPDDEVRTAAAKLAFAADRGGALVGELMVNLEAPARELRWWVVLALGGADDPISLRVLEQLAAENDLMMATAAVRALAQRLDGRAAWRRALDDPRAGVAPAAIFALARVATALDEVTLRSLATDPRPEVQAALAAYRARGDKVP